MANRNPSLELKCPACGEVHQMASDFLALVEQLRLKQDEYFRHRDVEVLNECKALEKRVDAVIFNVHQGDFFS